MTKTKLPFKETNKIKTKLISICNFEFTSLQLQLRNHSPLSQLAFDIIQYNTVIKQWFCSLHVALALTSSETLGKLLNLAVPLSKTCLKTVIIIVPTSQFCVRIKHT